MIVINKKDKVISIKGHAMYSKHGTDIVCASVSSIMYTTVNAILRFSPSKINYQDDLGKITITILEEDEIINTLISNMMALFTELETDYPKNIKIESEE